MNAVDNLSKRMLCGRSHLVYWSCALIALGGGSGCATMNEMAMAAAAPSTPGMSGMDDFMTQYQTMMALSATLAMHASLKPGEYARYRLPAGATAGSKAATLEWANLGMDLQGLQWSRMKFTDPSSGRPSIIETGASKNGGTATIRRKFPQDKEVVVQSVDMSRPNGAEPAKAVAKDATRTIDMGTEDITVPAGVFRAAKHVRYESESGNYDRWSAVTVAGGTLRLKTTSAGKAGGARDVVIELEAYGTNATSELGVVLAK